MPCSPDRVPVETATVSEANPSLLIVVPPLTVL